MDIPRKGIFWNPYFQIFITVLLTAAAQVLLKMGADSRMPDDSVASWMGVRPLVFGWTWLGVGTLLASFWSWLYALRFLPLGFAFGLANGVHVVVPLGALICLHETISPLRWSGIFVILLGIGMLAQSVAALEEKK